MPHLFENTEIIIETAAAPISPAIATCNKSLPVLRIPKASRVPETRILIISCSIFILSSIMVVNSFYTFSFPYSFKTLQISSNSGSFLNSLAIVFLFL